MNYFQRKSYLEDFSNELIIEIFDYLDGIDIYRAFSKLNNRLDCLLLSTQLNTKINIFSTSKTELTSHFNDIILPYRTRLISLFLWNNQVIEQFKSYLLYNITFENLQSIVLHKIQPEELFSILPCLTFLPYLFTLIIDCEYQLSSIIDLYLLIFRLSNIQYNKLTLKDQTYIPSSIIIPKQINNIQYLNLDYSCNLQLIIQIFFHTQKLIRFRCKKILKSNENINENLILHLPNLTHMTIESCNEKFHLFEIFLCCISKNLKKLKLSTSEDIEYLDVKHWQYLISKHMLYLTKFDFEYQQIINNDFRLIKKHLEFYHLKMSTFSIEHTWLFGLKIYVSIPFDILAFTICSYSSKYNSNIIPISQLTVNFISSSIEKSFFNQNIMPILSETYFTHLDINCTMMSPNMIIDLLNILPNLRELTVSYLKLSSCIHLLENKFVENTIEKITIKKLNDLNELKFFSNLCRQMKYLDISLGNNIKFEIFFENLQQNLSLSTICFHIHDTNIPLIQNSQLISNYSIKRLGSQILLTSNQ